MGFCVNQLGSRDEAEDAVQSTFLNAHRALQRGVTPEAELAWLFKIAHNVCLTRRRSTRRRVRVESASDLQAMQDVIPAPARERSDELIRLTDALAHMPDNQRRAILLREWQGLSYHEIADELGLSQSAVETLIFRARRTLAANLEVEPERASLLARAKGALDIGSLIMLAKGLFEGGAALKATAAAVAVSGAAVVATTPPTPAQEPPKAKTTPAVVAPAPAAPRATLDARGSFSSSGSARSENPRAQVDRTSSATKQKPAVVLPAPATSERAAPTEAAPSGAAFAEAPAAEAAAQAPPAPEQPTPAEKPKKKPEPPAQSAPPGQGKPDKPKDRDRGKHAEPGPVPVETAVVIPAESSEPAPAPPEQAADKQEKRNNDHGGGNGHRN